MEDCRLEANGASDRLQKGIGCPSKLRFSQDQIHTFNGRVSITDGAPRH